MSNMQYVKKYLLFFFLGFMVLILVAGKYEIVTGIHSGSNTYVNLYVGTPYPDNIPHTVPGTIEAENFDDGGEGIAYHDGTPGRQNGNATLYRKDVDVDIQSHGSGQYNIGFTENGEWTNYTIEVAEAGTYSIACYCVAGNGNGSFHFEVDGKIVSRATEAPYGDWSDFSGAATVEGVQLSEGKHVLKWYTYGGMNVDKFVFTRTGEWTGEDLFTDINYPITQPMHNPLFVQFNSPMYGSLAIGALYTADPSAHVWKDGRLYVYASHDMEPAKGCDRMDRYHVFSTDDMVHWTDHGEILSADDVKAQAGWGVDGFMWAPDCAYNPADETYYFYFPHPADTDWNKSWRIGVATSKDPARDFQVVGYVEGVLPMIDPCIFVDDDGQPYIYNGGGGTCMGGKLKKDDWTKLDGPMKEMQGLGDFHEATWIHKYKGTYYLSHSDNHTTDGNHMKYAISDSPLGPWEDKGIYMYPTGIDTNHGSIVEYKGQWYAFYHTGNYSGHGALRSVCVDPIEYNADGSLKLVRNWGTPYRNEIRKIGDTPLTLEAEDYNEGGEHYAYHKKANARTGNDKAYRPDDVSVSTVSGRTYVNNLTKGEWLRYSVTVEKGGRYDLGCVISPNKSGSRLHISVNGSDKTGSITATTLNNWKTVTVKDVVLQAGEQYLDVRIEEGDLNLDKLEIAASEPYKGTAYKNHVVPGVIEAEDFDKGGQGVAYNDDTPTENKGGYNYRTDKEDIGVDIENNSGNIHVSHANNGEWLSYTFDCQLAGTYRVEINVSNNPGGKAALHLAFNDADIHPVTSISTSGWNDFQPMTVSAVKLTEGKHVMKLYIDSSMNIDKCTFVLDAPSSINTTDPKCLSIITTGNGIKVNSRDIIPVSVYTLAGQIVYQGVSNEDILLADDMYIVKAGDVRRKVVIR